MADSLVDQIPIGPTDKALAVDDQQAQEQRRQNLVSQIPTTTPGMPSIVSQIQYDRQDETKATTDDEFFAIRNRNRIAERDAQIRAAIRRGLEADPEKAAELNKAAQESGVDPKLIEDRLVDYNRRRLETDYFVAAKDKRTLGDNLLRPMFAEQAGPDIPTLANMEEIVGGITRFIVGADEGGGLPGMIGRAPELIKEAGRQSYYQTRAAGSGINRLAGDVLFTALDTVGLGDTDIAKGAQAFAKEAGGAAAWAKKQINPSEYFIENAVQSGGASAISSLKYAPVAMIPGAGTAVALTMMAAETFGNTYADSRAKNTSIPKAIQHATLDAVYEFMFEKYMGFKGFMDSVKVGSSTGKLMFYEVSKEIPGEMLTTIGQNFNDFALSSPDKTLRQFFAELPADLAQTAIATMVGGSIQTGVARGTLKLYEKATGSQMAIVESEQQNLALRNLIEEAHKTALIGRNPGLVSNLVNEMAGEASVRFDARTLSQTLAQAGLTDQEIAQRFPSVAEQLLEQSVNNGEVSIPMGEFTTGIVGMDSAAQVIDIARAGTAELSTAEIKQAKEMAKEFGMLEQDAQKILAEMEDSTAFETSMDEVRQAVTQQLQLAGRTSKDANKQYANLMANWFAVQAKAVGVTPKELFDQFNPQIVKGITITGDTADARLQNAVMQAGVTSTANNAVMALDNPNLVVYQVESATATPKVLTTEAEIRAVPQDQLRVMPAAILANEPALLEQSGREGGDTTYAALARRLLDGMKTPKLSSVSLLDNAAGRPTFANNTELAAYFTEKNGPLAADLENPETIGQIVDAIYAESLHALTDAGNAIGWYDRKTKAALNIMAVAHPEILTDEQSRFAFTVILAVTSNGLRSRDNFVIAEELYRNVWKTGKTFPESVPKGGKTKNQMENSFALMNQLMDQMGWEKLRDFMVNTHAARDVVKFAGLDAARAGNFGEQASTQLMGALFLGPKIGSFFNNLYGDFSTITMDRWFMRTINRVRGQMLSLPGSFTKNLLALQDQLKGKIDTYGVDKKAIIAEIKAFAKLPAEQQADVLVARNALQKTMEYAKARHRDYAKPKDDGTGKKRSYLDRSEENRLAKNIDLALNGTMDAPGGAKDRSWIRSIMGQVQEKLAADGIEITNADLQAVLWYYEKDLYEKLKTEQELEDATESAEAKEAEDYETAARYAVSLLQQQGIVAGDAVIPRSAVAGGQTLQQAQTTGGGGVAPTFYSALSRAISGAKQESAPASDWLAIIKKLPGVKADEITWSGVEEFLQLAGKNKVTKQDLVAYMDANGVQLDETMLQGDTANKFVIAIDGEIQPELYNSEEEASAVLSEMVREYLDNQGLKQTNDNIEAAYERFEVVSAEGLDVPSMAKYGQYTLPGGENYQELLLTLPGQAKFQSAHWNNLNVLAHVRFNERTDVDGNRVLFIEELQSDWAQSGRKYGFPDKKPFKVFNVSDPQTIIAEFATLDEVTQFKQTNPYVEYSWEPQANKVPLAPFVEDTKSWVALTIKRMMRYAAENGFDKVAFVNGQQSADRYDLSKQVDELNYGDGMLVATQDGKIIISKEATPEDLPDIVGKEIAGRLLNNPTSITPSGYKRLSGVDLKVGGEGMIRFYDKIVPQVVNEQLKKIGGGKLEAVDFGRTESTDTAVQGRPNPFAVVQDVSVPVDGPVTLENRETGESINFATRLEAEKYMADYLGKNIEMVQPGFTITPEMRETIMAGLPMFQAGQEAARGTFDMQRMIIRLNESANLSTFLHEGGHFFLQAFSQMAMNPNAPQRIANDWATIQAWGKFDNAQWNAWQQEYQNTGNIPDGLRKVHEMWAESFEQYLFEGKAPSKELQSTFRVFSSWLTRIYRSIKQLFTQGKALSDEIREVMDRMLATEEQITAANERFGFDQNDDATQEAIEKLQARSLANMKWMDNARSKYIKRLQAESREQRKTVLAEVMAEVEQMPVYRALRWITTGSMVSETGEEIKATQGFKLDKDTVEAMFPAGMLNRPNVQKLSRAMTKEGLHPDIVADMFGYRDGVELVLDLIEAPTAKEKIKAMTDQRMLERFGDMYSPEQIEQAANEAVHNDARAKAIAAELKAQQDAMSEREGTGRYTVNGREITVNVLVSAAKDFAANIVSKTQTKNLKKLIQSYRQAEARAAKAWEAATKKGDTKAAIQAKRDQLLNMYTVKALQDAQADLGKITQFFDRVTKGNNESLVSRGRNPDIVAAARAILAAYGVGGRQGKSAVEYLNVLKTTDPDLYATMEPSVQGALNDAKDLKELTVQELQALKDEVESLWILSKRSRQMEVDGQLFDMESLEKMLVTQMEANGIPQDVPGARGALTKQEIAATKLRTARALLRRVEQWAESVDGKFNGPFSRFIFQPIKKAADAYRAQRTSYFKRYKALIESLVPYMDNKVIAAPELEYEFGRGHNGVGMAELLHAILHTGNESNKRKLLLGRNWATERDDGSLDTTKWDSFIDRMHREGTLRKEHYDFAQNVWDLLNELKAGAQKTHRTVFGRYFDEITASPVITPFGVYNGGYVPAQADPRIVTDANIRRLAEAENENMAYSFPSTSKGFTKGRTDYNRPLMLDLRSLSQHIDKVLLFTHMEPAVRDVNRLLRRNNVNNNINRIDNTIIDSMLIPWLNRSARQQVETPIAGDGAITKVLSVIRSRAGMALMFGNISNSVQQIAGFMLATVKVKNGHVRRATVEFAKSPRKMANNVAQLSPFMNDRMNNEIAAINNTVNEILLNESLYAKAQNWSMKHSYFLQTAIANTMEPIIWTGAYNQAIEDGYTEKDAITFADGVIRQTQGSTLPEDVSRIETGPAYARIFTQFVGYFNMLANTNATELIKISKEMGLKKGAGKMLYVVFAGILMQAWVSEAIAIAFRGGPDDEDHDGYLDDWLTQVFGMGTLKFTLATVPFIGQLANAGINRFNSNPADDRVSASPAVSLLESGVAAPASVYKAIFEEGKTSTAIKDVATLLTILTGLPFRTLAKPIAYGADVAENKVIPVNPVDVVRGAMTGTPSPESKSR